MALTRRFASYRYAENADLKCRKVGAIEARCWVGFVAGDAEYSGVVKSRIYTNRSRRKLLWNYGMRIRLHDAYCSSQGGSRSKCNRYIHKARRRVRISPGDL